MQLQAFPRPDFQPFIIVRRMLARVDLPHRLGRMANVDEAVFRVRQDVNLGYLALCCRCLKVTHYSVVFFTDDVAVRAGWAKVQVVGLLGVFHR